MTSTNERRFWAKVAKTDSCWIWIAALDKKGYGMFSKGGRLGMMFAHRFSYELHKGAIPEGTEIDHLCRNPRCVNPDHLEAVSHQENLRRGKGSEVIKQKFMRRTHCKRGHELTSRNTRIVSEAGYLRRKCRKCESQASRRYFLRRNNPVITT